MAKQGMKRDNSKKNQQQNKNEQKPVPEIQGKAKSGKERVIEQ